jgi:hypothetical protein
MKALIGLTIILGLVGLDAFLFDARHSAAVWQRANYTGSRFTSAMNLGTDRVLRK